MEAKQFEAVQWMVEKINNLIKKSLYYVEEEKLISEPSLERIKITIDEQWNNKTYIERFAMLSLAAPHVVGIFKKISTASEEDINSAVDQLLASKDNLKFDTEKVKKLNLTEHINTALAALGSVDKDKLLSHAYDLAKIQGKVVYWLTVIFIPYVRMISIELMKDDITEQLNNLCTSLLNISSKRNILLEYVNMQMENEWPIFEHTDLHKLKIKKISI